mmetsp:Transcript_36937/g.84473  ORF Transcript_36937/g.84473 Transcript_36937/m.84473 type:complete len:287 (+) Transcript_36937:1296-2156(+)
MRACPIYVNMAPAMKHPASLYLMTKWKLNLPTLPVAARCWKAQKSNALLPRFSETRHCTLQEIRLRDVQRCFKLNCGLDRCHATLHSNAGRVVVYCAPFHHVLGPPLPNRELCLPPIGLLFVAIRELVQGGSTTGPLNDNRRHILTSGSLFAHCSVVEDSNTEGGGPALEPLCSIQCYLASIASRTRLYDGLSERPHRGGAPWAARGHTRLDGRWLLIDALAIVILDRAIDDSSANTSDIACFPFTLCRTWPPFPRVPHMAFHVSPIWTLEISVQRDSRHGDQHQK